MLAQTGISVLDLIPGARNAVNYVISKVAEFQRIPQRLDVAQTNLANVKRAADAKGNMAVSAEATFAIQTARNIYAEYPKVAFLVGVAMDKLRNEGLLAGVVDVAGAVLDAAVKVAATINGTKAIEDSASSLANKMQVHQVQVAAQAGDYSKYLLYGGLLYAGLWALRRGRGTRRW